MPSTKRAVYLNADLHKALRAKSAEMDLTVAELVSKAARTYLADAADEAMFGRQEPSVSFRSARATKNGTKAGHTKGQQETARLIAGAPSRARGSARRCRVGLPGVTVGR